MRYMTGIIVVFVLMAVGWAAPSRGARPARAMADTEPTEQARDAFAHRFELDLPLRQARRRIEEAIASGIRGMNFLKRPLARRQLARDNRPFETVRFRFPADEIVVRFEDQAPVRSPQDGGAAPYTLPDGERVQVRQRQVGRQLVQRFHSERGERINQFELGSGGHRLTMRVEVRSPYLPRPVRYALPYRRSEAR